MDTKEARKPELFVVVNKEGKHMMSTEQESCIYPPDTLLHMKSHGYTFLMNGEAWDPEAKAKRGKNADKKAPNSQMRLF